MDWAVCCFELGIYAVAGGKIIPGLQRRRIFSRCRCTKTFPLANNDYCQKKVIFSPLLGGQDAASWSKASRGKATA
jgi:hypothetical protein